MNDSLWKTRFENLNSHLLIALALTIVYHGGLLLSGTFKRTYDAFVHIFFADHYARAWFDHWEYRWYTGFTMTSYPPGSQQSVALLSHFFDLLNSFVIVQLFALIMVVIGIYRFSRLWVSEEASGYAALLIVFSSGINETVHVFGQLPTTFSLGFLLNALPYAYEWLDTGDWRKLLVAWSVNAATTAGHHVTTLFGAVFFMGPVFVLAIVKKFRTPVTQEPSYDMSLITRANIRPIIMRRLRRIMPVIGRSTIYGLGLIGLLVLVVLPYWLWSVSDPIAQVSIPHASRDSFIENPIAGLVFWLVPYGVSLLILPYIFYKAYSTKAWPLAASLTLLFILGTGGTTPIPKLLLRGAFDILTLDRFTFWAIIILLPFAGEFVRSLRHGRVAHYLQSQFGYVTWRIMQVGLVVIYLATAIGVANLTQFRRFQPDPIDPQPIVNFLHKDQHDKWRYLTLGFGDQFAWLSAQTTATSIDGNYHSARRLPELTTTPVERLEGAKFSGIPGIGSLQQFLAVPDKYNLKFVFSNDQFYDPLLYFSGWHRVQRLENGVMVWERNDIPPLPEVLPRKEIPIYQRVMWGLIPMGVIFLSFIAMLTPLWSPWMPAWQTILPYPFAHFLVRWQGKAKQRLDGMWTAVDERLLALSHCPTEAESQTIIDWHIWREWFGKWALPAPAPPSAQMIRTGLLGLVLLGLVGGGITLYLNQTHTPEAVLVAYYDDLDFRRFESAYERLVPNERPLFEAYMLELSVNGGLLASYAKLDSITVKTLINEPTYRKMQVHTSWVTAINLYESTQIHELMQVNGRWLIIPPPPNDITIPPDQLYRQRSIDWYQAGRRQVTTATTTFSDVLDRPELQILSARLVQHQGRYSVVGELMNIDVDPADVTVTAYLYDENGDELTWYNAQTVIMHKLLPKEVTPFRIDFEGVAGAILQPDGEPNYQFHPYEFTSPTLANPIANFEVYAKAVVTTQDLQRNLSSQQMRLQDNQLTGELLNTGTQEATIPHLLLTYYDDTGAVAWVDHHYLAQAVRPQRSQPFTIPLTHEHEVQIIQQKGDTYSNILADETIDLTAWQTRHPLPSQSGYSSYRLTVHQFVGTTQ